MRKSIKLFFLLINLISIAGFSQSKSDPILEAIAATERSPEGKFHKSYELARTAYSEKRYKDAVKFYTQALEQRLLAREGYASPSAYAVYLYRADAKYKLGDYWGGLI